MNKQMKAHRLYRLSWMLAFLTDTNALPSFISSNDEFQRPKS